MGWGDAWAGLSQQSFGLAVDSLRGMQQNKYQTQRDEAARIAEEKREEARRAWEERMMDKKAKLDSAARQSDRSARLDEIRLSQEFETQMDRTKAEREANDPYRKALAEEARARAQAMRTPSSGGGRSGGGAGLAQPKAPDSVLSQANKDFVAEVGRLVAKGRTPEQAQGEAFAKLQSIYDRDILSRIRPGLSNMQGQVSRIAGALGRKTGDVMQYFNP